jgi:hypothetical protein
MAAVPPVSEKVFVVAAASGAEVELVADVELGAVVEVGAVVDGVVVLGFDTDGDVDEGVGRAVEELFESWTVARVVEGDAGSVPSDVFDSAAEADDPPAVVSTPATTNPTSSADGGAMIWLSTTDTPAHATPTAPALAANHIMNNTTLLIQSSSPFALRRRLKMTLNEP